VIKDYPSRRKTSESNIINPNNDGITARVQSNEVETSLEVVSLDGMNGFEFQIFVAHLFERLGYGEAEEINQVRDAGKDVVIRGPKGLVIIECKHQPKGSVGRPVVQKLHSAILTSGAKKGYLVTTGRFSRAAFRYTQDLGTLIELVDSRILYDMANRAKIRVIQKGESTVVYQVLPPSQELIAQEAITHIAGNVISHPNPPHRIAKTTVLRTHFISAYLLEYRLHEDFSTTVGRIHSIHVDKGRVLINGQNGELIKPSIERIVTKSDMVEKGTKQLSGSSGRFTLGYSAAKRQGLKQVQQHHAETVSYYGRNNVHYTKECVPHISRILIRNLVQVYIPPDENQNDYTESPTSYNLMWQSTRNTSLGRQSGHMRDLR
jgi:restriction system protein